MHTIKPGNAHMWQDLIWRVGTCLHRMMCTLCWGQGGRENIKKSMCLILHADFKSTTLEARTENGAKPNLGIVTCLGLCVQMDALIPNCCTVLQISEKNHDRLKHYD